MNKAKHDLSFYRGKNVLVTGHTGFKGAWLSKILSLTGANVIGYSLEPPTSPSLFDILQLDKDIVSIHGDICNYKKLSYCFDFYKPEIVFHLAAQSNVLLSYKEPLSTLKTNIMGTANLLECIRKHETVKSFLNVTTDKVYLNKDDPEKSFKEDDALDGFDPYSNSKSCSDLVTHTYKNSFFDVRKVASSTARAGNAIGGGDFAANRIVPDILRAIQSNKILYIRNPNSTRPFQHVFEALRAYLIIAEKQYLDPSLAGSYNIGPDKDDCLTIKELVHRFCDLFDGQLKFDIASTEGPKESNYLNIDCSKMKKVFGWEPLIKIDEVIKLTADWSKTYLKRDLEAIRSLTKDQIYCYFDI